jgi:hypothetical protein
MDLDYTRALYPPEGEHLGKKPTQRCLISFISSFLSGFLTCPELGLELSLCPLDVEECVAYGGKSG